MEPKADIGAIARMAAEKSRSELAEIGFAPRQQAALVDAMRLILMHDERAAKEALAHAEFDAKDIDRVFPVLVYGLQQKEKSGA
jgi:hypothetical protein